MYLQEGEVLKILLGYALKSQYTIRTSCISGDFPFLALFSKF